MVFRSLALLALVGTTAGASSMSPKAVSLTIADLPAGYSLTVTSSPISYAWAEAVRVPVSQLVSHGFRSAYIQSYLRRSDLQEIDVSVVAYTSVAGAQWEYNKSIRLDPKQRIKVSAPSVGAQSVSWRDKGKTTFEADFRQGNFDNVVVATSPNHSLNVNDAIHYARLITKRESR
jgi:hypothetical protein